MEFLAWIEETGFSTWIRESECVCGYDMFLVAHAIGMAAVVGLSATVALRVLGVAKSVPLAPMEKFFPFMYAGFWLNFLSGAVLLVAYPTRAATNPGFYVKIAGIVLAVVCLRRVKRLAFEHPDSAGPESARAKMSAGALLFSWWGAIVAGRLLAYHGIADVEWQSSIAIVSASAVMLLGGTLAGRVLGWGGNDEPTAVSGRAATDN